MNECTLSRLTGKNVSPLAFGVMQFGGKANATESARMYTRARAAGITVFDAAYIYTDGAAETLLGEFAEGERDDLILISKCAYRPGMRGTELIAQVEESLRRLRTDYVDVMFLHRYPGDALLEETLEAMKTLHAAGTYRMLGASNFAAWEVMKAQSLASRIGSPPITILQPMYNLVKRQAEVEILPMAQREGLSVLSYSPLGGGLLTGKYSQGGSGRIREDERYAARYAPEWMAQAAARLDRMSAELNVPAPALAVAWARAHPGITAPIVSASSESQMGASLAAMEVTMDAELYGRLSSLTPRPAPATDRLEEA
ncbi:aldo/keto reductase [Algicella marina]|uniref:Aldo/keto reductase n=1 Tax=Algicella marina TaxID=2683284 RepID=A0A6P1T1S6_9RHOB|nr:aldo/keto reductase [Algicella marina]QHQ35715.1 aldo/keto reductase [Algicella marina]